LCCPCSSLLPYQLARAAAALAVEGVGVVKVVAAVLVALVVVLEETVQG
jgi:hypothetical protein